MTKELPKEGCGVILEGPIFYPCRNSAEGNENFILNDIDWILAQLKGKVIGIIHSHPISSAEASEFDKIQAGRFNLPYHIISMIDNSMETYTP
jgi:proteasome lid subunit RPN8/RPN11